VNCRELEQVCTSYVDGELDERRASAVRGHLRGCSSCRDLIGSEVLVRDAADELGPMEPPEELWSAIEARIAAEEIHDGDRSRLWFWWQSLREHALPASVGVVAVAVVVIWFARGQQSAAPATASVQPSGSAALAQTSAPEAAAAVIGFEQARRREIARTDERYQKVLRDLRSLVEEERPHWSPDEAAVFDKRTAELHGAIAEQEARLALLSASASPADRDALYRVYREEIELLERASVEGVLR